MMSDSEPERGAGTKKMASHAYSEAALIYSEVKRFHNNKKRFPCSSPGCTATFSRPSRLATHTLSHTGERPFECADCDKTFTRQAHLTRHVQVNHQGKKTPTHQMDCEQCDSTFSSKYSLKKHMNKVHMVKQYSCTDCERTFHKNHLLKAHQTEHTGALPWACSQCDKHFQYEMYLKRHMRLHAGYTCKECGVTMDRWSDLQQHMSTEHPVEPAVVLPCTECGKQFKEGNMLRRHKTVHGETRDVFQCPHEFCPRYFYFKSNLSHHVKSYHEGQKHRCSEPECGDKFYTRQRLLDHLLRAHGEEGGWPARKKPKKGEERKRRKDQGKFKKPMATWLTGVEARSQDAVKELLEGEVRTLDCLEELSREEFVLDSTSEAVSEEEVVGELQNPREVAGEVLGLMARPRGHHFKRMWGGGAEAIGGGGAEDMRVSESDTDTDAENVPRPPAVRNTAVDFSKFLKK